MNNDNFLALTTEILLPSNYSELENETATSVPKMGSIERSLATDDESNQALDVSLFHVKLIPIKI